jgi:glycosyltransferase involved in cell wall biosynthesis
MIKVAMVGLFPFPGDSITGGVERVIATLVPALSKHVEVRLFAPSSRSSGIVDSVTHSITYTRKGPGPGLFRYSTFDSWMLEKEVKAYKPDVVHVQAMAGYCPTIEVPTIFTAHGIAHVDILHSQRGKWAGQTAKLIASKLLNKIEERALHKIDSVIAINPYVTIAWPSLSQKRMFSIPNPVDKVYSTGAVNHSLRGPNIVSVGRISLLKDTERIITLCAPLLKSDKTLRLQICGPAESVGYLEHCKQLTRQLGVTDNVIFMGNLTPEELVTVLDRAQFLIIASKQEMAPLSISEALCRGVPVAGPKLFGIQYMINEGINGFFLKGTSSSGQEDTEVLRSALVHRWDRPSLTEEARNVYSTDSVAASTFQAYCSIV